MDIICVTDRKQSVGDFYRRIEQIALAKPTLIILREKDLSENEFNEVCLRCREIVPMDILSVNTFIDIAKNNEIRNIHLSFEDFIKKGIEKMKYFKKIGVSIHSKDEAIIAEKRGASYLIAGHIFATDCKKGVAPRGMDFLEEVCKVVDIPVYAIGGITKDKVKDVKKAGASGICVMSSIMKTSEPYKEVKGYLEL